MSEIKHTPGPWMAYDGSIVSGRVCIAVIEDDGGCEAPRKQRIANAQLISAAPELLAAARKVLEGLNARIEQADAHAVPVFAGIADLHDAINKATLRTEQKKDEGKV